MTASDFKFSRESETKDQQWRGIVSKKGSINRYDGKLRFLDIEEFNLGAEQVRQRVEDQVEAQCVKGVARF